MGIPPLLGDESLRERYSRGYSLQENQMDVFIKNKIMHRFATEKSTRQKIENTDSSSQGERNARVSYVHVCALHSPTRCAFTHSDAAAAAESSLDSPAAASAAAAAASASAFLAAL